METEIWKQIGGYEGLYEISNLGRIKSIARNGTIKRDKILSPCIVLGYHHIKLSKNNKCKWMKVHRLVAMAFIPNPENKPDINHINLKRNDNRVENLEWCTRKENWQHAVKMGKITYPKGEFNPKNKLSLKEIEEIRHLYSKKTHTQKELAKKFGVSQSHISTIILRKQWIT